MRISYSIPHQKPCVMIECYEIVYPERVPSADEVLALAKIIGARSDDGGVIIRFDDEDPVCWPEKSVRKALDKLYYA